MQDKLRAALQAIQGVKIPELPTEVLALEEEIKSKFGSLAKAAEIIEMNTTLSGEVMRLVQSPIIETKEPVNSIRDAVNVLGFDNLYNLVVSSALQNLFSGDGVLKDIMDNSVDVAFCMADLSEYVEGVSRDEAYMLGLFHNVGALLMATKDAKAYEPLFSDSMILPNTVIAKENAVFGSNHAMIGVLIAKKWHLPIHMLNAIMLHHNQSCRRIENDQVRAMVAMIKVANAVVAEISLGAYRGEEMKNYEADGAEELMIDEEEISTIRSSLMSYSFKS